MADIQAVEAEIPPTKRPRIAMMMSTRPQDWAEPVRSYLFTQAEIDRAMHHRAMRLRS